MVEKRIREQKTYELIGEWLKDYHSGTDKYKKAKAKALIVTRMLPVIKRIAHTIARRANDPIDDLVQAGAIGLLKAIDKYSNDISDNFRIYAGYRIIGEMKHYLRDKSHTIRVPRHVYELSYRINSFISTLTLDELNELTSDDVAEALQLPSKEVDFVMNTDRRRKSVVSLDTFYSESADNSHNLSYEEVLPDNDYRESSEIEDFKIVFKDAIKQLPDEYKKLIELFYYEDLTQKEIGEMYNLSQMQISRKFKKAFSMLYKMIADHTGGNNPLEPNGIGD